MAWEHFKYFLGRAFFFTDLVNKNVYGRAEAGAGSVTNQTHCSCNNDTSTHNFMGAADSAVVLLELDVQWY